MQEVPEVLHHVTGNKQNRHSAVSAIDIKFKSCSDEFILRINFANSFKMFVLILTN